MIYKFPLCLLLLLAGLFFGIPVAGAGAAEYYWGRHPEHERIVFQFPEQIQDFSVIRTGREELSLILPENTLQSDATPSRVDFSGSRFIREVQTLEDDFVVIIRLDAFGFIYFPLPAENKIVIDIFQDPLGAQWRPEAHETLSASAEQVPGPGSTDRETVAEPDPEEPGPGQPRGFRMRTPVERAMPEDSIQTADSDPPLVSASRISMKIEREAQPEEPLPEDQPREVMDMSEDMQPLPGDPEPEETDKYEELVFAAKIKMSAADFRGAVHIFERLLQDPELPGEYLEDILYSNADAHFQMFRHDMRGNFKRIVTNFERAIHFDPNSERLPNALLNLGYIHLQVGNQPEARGYFNLIRERFPHHPSVPSTYYYWGEFFLRQNMFHQAADNFQHILDHFPDDRLVKPAAVNLARAFSELDHHALALDVLEYVQRRWPRHHIDEPDFLILAGYILYSNGQLQQAREKFLHYINLEPLGDQVDVSMARIGDIYLLQGKKQAARDMYEETIRQFPDQEGGLIAAMRLAEEGIYDQPSIMDMFSVFDQPFTLRPKQIYTRISQEFPDSPLAPVALLKLAMWDLFHDNHLQSLESIELFNARYAHKDLWPRALEIGFETFSRLVEKRFRDNDFSGIIRTWEEYDYLNSNARMLDGETTLALATAYWNNDRLNEAVVLARPFLDQARTGDHKVNALSLVLGIYLEMRDWEKIMDLVQEVHDLDLPEDKKLQLDYANALALQNMGMEDQALPIWRNLAVETAFPGSQRAYALFFLAQDALSKTDYEKAYVFAQESLALFMDQQENNLTNIRTNLDMLIEATSRTGRIREALGWALEYQNHVLEDDPEMPGILYRLARMYRLNHQYEQWERVLNEIIRDYPDDVFSRMAGSDLNTRRLTTEAEKYAP